MLVSRTLTLILIAFSVFVNAQYQFTREYSGPSFFDRWQFYDNYDNLTNGDAIYVSRSVAFSSKLAFVNDNGNAIIKVDNTTMVPSNQKRNTVRITSIDSYGIGSLWVADITHVPFGCSVWPAWWSQAKQWPQGGEIDTFEGVNMVTTNHMSLHTEPGCNLDRSSASFTGLVNSTDCSFSDNANEGCAISDPRPQSYGSSFAQSGGGVFATEFTGDGISIWFFDRASVPPSLSNGTGNIDTSTLGTPVANYPSKGCSINNFFAPQYLIFDITLCGDFAGNPDTFAQTCSGNCYNDFVIGPPANYDNAYFEIKGVKTYNDPNVKVSASGAAPTRFARRFGFIIAAVVLAVGLT